LPLTAPPAPAAQARDVPGLASWHAGWAVAAALLALAGQLIAGGQGGPVFFAILAAAVPGLFGLMLLWRDGALERTLVLAVWGLSASVVSLLAGGAGGPLGAFLFLPLLAGVAFAARRHVWAGAGGTAVAALAGFLSVRAVGGPGTDAPLATLAAVMTALAGAFAMRLATADRERRLRSAEGSAGWAEAVLAGQPGLILLIEPSGRVLAAYGAPPQALPVQPLFDAGLIAAVHAPDRPAVLSAIERALQGTESQCRFAPRMVLDRRVLMSFRRFEDAGAVRLIAHAQDGTAQYVQEVSLETARAEAEAHNAGKTRFLANMSHELRTPLNAVIGFADIMRQRIFGPLPPRYAEYADSIHEAGGHLLDLINDVLDVSKLEAERYELSLERFDARDAFSAAIALVRVSAEEKGVKLAGVLPSEPLTVQADRRALKQIALNLLSNGVKFTPAGGSVTLTAEAIGPYLELVVSDTGVGVAPEDLKRLGRPFEQAGGAEQRAQGTGLGLSLVRALAELHGGRMSLDSTLGEGTAVTVRLPVAQATRPEGGAEVIPFAQGARQ